MSSFHRSNSQDVDLRHLVRATSQLQEQVRSTVQRLEQSSSSNSGSAQSGEQTGTRGTDQSQRTGARISNSTTRSINDSSDDNDGRYAMAMGEIYSYMRS